MIVQNNANSTNFGSITKYRVKAKDLEHFKNNIDKKFEPGKNFVFNESIIHHECVKKITEQENFEIIRNLLDVSGFKMNDSLRLNSKDEHYNIYIVNEPKDIKLLTKKTVGVISQIKNLFKMERNLKWAEKQIQPLNDFGREIVQTLGMLKFTDEVSKDLEKLAKKHGMKEFNYSVKRNGEMVVKQIDQPVDGIRFRMKTADADEFVDTVTGNMSAALKRQNKIENFMVENPRYIEFEEEFDKLKYGNWAAQNLKNRGYDVALPVGEDPSGALDFYVFTSENANKKLKKKFEGFRSLPEYMIDTIKAKSTAEGFSNSVDGAQNDIHFTDAYKLLYEHELNKHQNKRFQKLLKKMNIGEVEYQPKEK